MAYPAVRGDAYPVASSIRTSMVGTLLLLLACNRSLTTDDTMLIADPAKRQETSKQHPCSSQVSVAAAVETVAPTVTAAPLLRAVVASEVAGAALLAMTRYYPAQRSNTSIDCAEDAMSTDRGSLFARKLLCFFVS